jgi:site-specific DNA recombinase
LNERKLQVDAVLSDRRVALASPEIVKRYACRMRKVLELSKFAEKKAFLLSFILYFVIKRHRYISVVKFHGNSVG